MSTLIESYGKILDYIKEINQKINDDEAEITRLSTSYSEDISMRITKLEEQLEKIDDYLLKIRGFQELAKKNLDSQNVLTIDAPPGYRVNLNRLRNWAMMIDPNSSNDPYAQRVYIVSKCDECFLEKKQREFKNRIELLSQEQSGDMDYEIQSRKKRIEELKKELKEFVLSEQMSLFSKDVVSENESVWNKIAPTLFKNNENIPETISPGAYSLPLPFDEEQRGWLKATMGDFYDSENGRVLIPARIVNNNEYVLTISCSTTRRNKLDRALQNLVLSTINENPAGSRKIYVLDGVRFNSTSMGTLRQLEGSYVLNPIPRNPEQLTSTLEQIVSSFADIDEIIEMYDSVAEYNESVEDKDKLPFTTILIYGWPNSFEGRDLNLIKKIMINYERYGISLITVSYRNNDKQEKSEIDAMPENAKLNSIHISMLQNDTTICFSDSKPQKFTWYMFNDSLAPEYVESVLSKNIEKDKIGNEYTKRYSLTSLPEYTRSYKKIELPFGIDGKDEAHCVSFENENFATYLVGASRSGKSTLLHTLIAGLIRNYHPDNVELWLADFKQLEFKRYIKHLPPHVKYVLLDESSELVFDLIDRLTDEMMTRQKLFSRLGVQRIDQVNPTLLDKPLPVIFVILDEFSIMSQSISESPIYKLRLQNILAKGAALGIKFLFSSQTFTTGVAGLTSTARAQIQQRISMKGSKDEISATLELSSNLKTEQVNNWMEALPPHYALVKFRMGADTLPQVKRFLVMYFEDYLPRDNMIDDINAKMHPVDVYNPSDINSYVDKHPVLVDGNTYDAFNEQGLSDYINYVKTHKSNDLSGDEMFVSFGTPRLMSSLKPAAISAETRENILLIARAAEQNCAASIILSTLKSYQVQNGKVQIWAYSRNKLYRSFKQVFIDNGIKLVEDIDDICDEIRKVKESIAKKESSNMMIAMIGLDRICMDFDYLDNDGNTSQPKQNSSIQALRSEFVKKGAVVSDENEELKRLHSLKWIKYKREHLDKLRKEGKSEEEINKMIPELLKAFNEEFPDPTSQNTKSKTLNNVDNQQVSQEKHDEKVSNQGAYNALDDFVYIIKQGSRLGYHFILDLNSLADLKYCNLKSEFFRYKMAFQISADDSRSLFSNKIASTLPEHICQFDDTLEKYSFRPYLHKNINWEGWYVDEDGNVVSPFEDNN